MEQLLLQGVLLGALVGISAFFAASEVAFLSISPVRLHSLMERKAPGAECLMRLRANRRKVVISLLIGNNVANVAASAVATAMSMTLFGEAGLGIAVGITSFLLLTFGDITPKSAATTYGEKMALLFAPWIEATYKVCYPLVVFFERINMLIPGIYSRATGIERFTEEEVRSAVRLGAQHKSISESELSMIENVLAFNDLTVEHAMTPKARVLSFTAETTVKDALKQALSSNYTRFPVTRKKEVAGTVSIRMLSQASFEQPGSCVGQYTLAPVKIRKDEKLNSAFAMLRKQGRKVAIVTDERDEMIGVVTLEDFLGELIGKTK
ncbi:MAG: CNNM domain-containing protein [Candidatus Micrarchaeia archaeon]